MLRYAGERIVFCVSAMSQNLWMEKIFIHIYKYVNIAAQETFIQVMISMYLYKCVLSIEAASNNYR